jgi:hypothetical protein
VGAFVISAQVILPPELRKNALINLSGFSYFALYMIRDKTREDNYIAVIY